MDISKFLKYNTVQILHICSQLHTIPFNWLKISLHGGSKRIEFKNRKWQLYVCKFMSLLTCFYFVTIALDFYLHYRVYMDGHNLLEMILHAVWVCCFAYISTYQCHFFFQKKAIANLVNQVMSLSEHLKEMLGPEEFECCWKKTNKIMCLFFMSACSGVMCNVLLFLRFPFHRRYFYAFFPNAMQNPIIFVIMIFYELYFIIFQWGALLMEVFVHFNFIQTTGTALKILRCSKTDLSFKTKIRIYQKLRLLSQIYDECCGKFILPAMKVTFGSIIIFSVAALIHLFGKTDVIVTLVLTVFSFVGSAILFVLFQEAAGMYNLSSECLAHFRTILNVQSYEEHCLYKICSPIGVKVGSYYYFKSSTPLTFFKIVLEYIINLLLSFGH